MIGGPRLKPRGPQPINGTSPIQALSVMRITPAIRLVGAAVLGLLLLAPAALAADGERTPLNLTEPKATAAQAAGSTSSGLVRTIVGLAVVIGVIYGLYWILKQVKASREDRASGVGLHTLATLPLGQNRSMQLVRAGTEVVLVGVGEAGVTPIRTYGEHEARALGLLPDDDDDDQPSAPVAVPVGLPGATKPTFRQALSRTLDGLRSKTVIK
jgi:flagellar protein FliO/FliZ